MISSPSINLNSSLTAPYTMEAIARFYPPLDERKPIPAWYLPGVFALTLLPFFSAHRRRAALLVLPVLLSACLLTPSYTFGNPPADFYRSSGFVTTPLWFIEFAILRPQAGGDAPLYVGSSAKDKGVPIEDCCGIWAKLRWAAEIMLPSHRGIGWNWQIKNIPADPRRHLPKKSWVNHQVKAVIVSYIASVLLLVVLGASTALEKNDVCPNFLLDAVIGWAGAIWIYCRLCCFYSSSSTVTVALGVYEIWQLPPLMGNLRDAWSVRQFWAVYHQTMRQLVSAPARRIARALGLQKGSLASSLCQLYIGFGVSCIVHQYQMFNVMRQDMGEYAFFMSQPVVISLESVAMYMWRRFARPGRSIDHFGVLVGYLWVLVWFSFSLPIYIKGSRDAGVVRDAFLGTAPFDFGALLMETALMSRADFLA